MRRLLFAILVIALSLASWLLGPAPEPDTGPEPETDPETETVSKKDLRRLFEVSPAADADSDPEILLALAAIREEGLNRSQVMMIAEQLTDEFGPRLTGSPSLERAGEWAMNFLADRGAKRVHKEGWDFGHPGWENQHLDIHVVSPVQEPLVAEVYAWTPSTNGTIRADIVHLDIHEPITSSRLEELLASIKDKVQSKIVFVGNGLVNVSIDTDPSALTPRHVDARIMAFLVENGAAARVNSSGMPDGLIRAFGNRTYDVSKAVPTVILRTEDFGRLVRLLRRGRSVQLELVIENQVYPRGKTAFNYIAEFGGQSKSHELIMMGAHLDSWHAATGATDNAAGSAIMIEAMRILLALDLQTERTIRMALWTGEEQGLLGSKAYVRSHFGTDENPAAEFEVLGGYVNVDTGTGRLQSALVFGPESAADVLSRLFRPLSDLGISGAKATDSRVIGGSDHTTFNAAGLPGISMVQDPVRYRTHTWHTNIDTYEQLLPEHLKQAAVVVASTVYQLAMEEHMIPRFSPPDMPTRVREW